MNKAYRSVWNESLGAWVAASELSRSKGKGGSTRRIVRSGAAAAMLALGGLSLMVSGSVYAYEEAGGQDCNGANGRVSIGAGSQACQDGAIAIGSSATAANTAAVAIGSSADATGARSVALGAGASATGGNQGLAGNGGTALGAGAQAIGGGNVAIGGATAGRALGGPNYNVDAVAIGSNAVANNDNSVAIGAAARATGQGSAALGAGARANGSNAIALGASTANTTLANGNNSVAIGVSAVTNVDATGGVALGFNSASQGARAIAIGGDATAVTTNSIAIGANAVANANAAGGVAVGIDARSQGARAIAIGGGATAAAAYSVALGSEALSQSTNSIAIGLNAVANANAAGGVAMGIDSRSQGARAIAIGGDATAAADNSVAMGNTAQASAVRGIAIGTNANAAAGAADTVAIGTGATASATGAIAMGRAAQATGTGSIAIGDDAIATGSVALGVSARASNGGVALGDGAVATYNGGVNNPSIVAGAALGVNANADVSGATALGSGSVATNVNDVALGAGSITATAVGTASTVINGTTYTNAGATPTSTVSVGTVGAERTITNVAAGRVSATSTDAINGSQLFATNTAIQGVADTPLTFTGNTGTVDRKLGQTLAITGDATTAGTYSGANLKTEVDPATGTVKLQMTDAPVFTSVTTGNTTLNTNGLTITGGPSVTTAGINANNTVITNVAPGAAGTDAVNVNQLNVVNTTANKGWNVQANGDAATNVAPGDTVQFKDGQNIAVTRNGKDLTIATTPALTADSLTINNGGPVINNTGITLQAGNTLNVGGNQITNVAAGTNTTDAVNVGQLTDLANTPLTFTGNSGTVDRKLGQTLAITGDAATAGTYSGANLKTEVDPATGTVKLQMTDAPVFTSVTTGNSTLNTNGLTIIGGPSVTTAGINAGGTQITNVAAGTAGTDAVNVDQLTAVNTTANKGWNVQANGDAATNVAPGDTVQFKDGQNIAVTRNGKDLTIATTPALTADSLTINGGPVINNTGITMQAGNTLNMGGNQITNVAAGTAGTDAVNLNQLTTAQAAATTHYYSVNDGGTQGANYNNDGATGLNSIAAGMNAVATQQNTVAIGNGASVTAIESIAVGRGATAAGQGEVTLGTAAGVGGSAGNFANVNIGYIAGTNVSGGGITSIGYNAGNNVAGRDSAFIGSNAGNNSSGTNNYALGSDAGQGTVGNNNLALGTSSGPGGGATTTDSISIGNMSTPAAGTQRATSIGLRSNARADDAVALGSYAAANNVGDVALGAGSVTATTIATASTVINGTTYNYAGTTPTSTVSVGDVGSERTITNVAAGRVSGTSTDAINGSQLFATNSAIQGVADTPLTFTGNDNTAGPVTRKLGDTLAISGTATTAGTYSGANLKTVTDASTGAVNLQMADNPTFTSVTTGNTTLNTNGLTITGGPSVTTAGINANNTVITNVAPGAAGTDAVNVNQLNVVNTTANKGWNVQANGDTATNVAPGDTVQFKDGQNIAVTRVGKDITIATTPALTADSLTINNGGPVINNTGITLQAGNTLNVGGNQITNVAAGTNTTDAVNVGQLTDLANKPLTFTGNTGAVDRKLGDTLAITGTASTAGTYSGANLKTEVVGNEVQVQMADNPNFASVTAGNSTLNTNGLTIIGGPSVTTAGINANNTVITNVAPGAAGTDAVNVNQLNVVNTTANKGWNVSANGGAPGNIAPGDTLDVAAADANTTVAYDATGKKLTVGVVQSPNFTTVTTTGDVNVGGNLTVTGATNLTGGATISNNLTVTPGTTVNMGGNQITNVAAGTNPTDAANVSQITTLADTPLTFTGNSGTVDRKLGQTLAITGEATTTGTYSGANLKTEVDPATGTVKLQMTDTPVFTSVTTGNSTLNTNGLTIIGGPSVTTAGINANNTVITNVAPGAAGTDAVNVDQLTAVNTTANKGWNVSANGGAPGNIAPGDTLDVAAADANTTVAYDATGKKLTVGVVQSPNFTTVTTTGDVNVGGNLTVTGATNLTGGATISNNLTVTPGTTVNMGGNQITNVAAGTNPTDVTNVQQVTNMVGVLADTPLTFTGNSGTVDRKLGQTLAITGEATTAGTYSGANLKTEVDSATGTVKLQMTDAPVFTSVTTGNSTLNTNGLTIIGGPSVTSGGINAGGTQITNVAAGAAGTDAVNVDQLTAVNTTASKGWNVQANGDTATNVAPGDTVQFKDGQNIAVTRNGKDLTIATTPALTADSLTINNGGPVINNTGITLQAGNTLNMGGNQITNVAAGTNPTDAANVGQITDLANTPLTFTGNTGTVDRKLGQTLAITGDATTAGTYSGANLKTEVDATTGTVKLQLADAPSFTSVTTGNTTLNTNGLTITGGPSVTTAGVNANNTAISNVAPGTAGTDAVNVDQLTAVNTTASKGWNVQANGDTATNVAPGDTVQFKDGQNIAVTRNGKDITIATTPALTADSLTINNGGPVINNTGITLQAGNTLNVGGNQITNVAAGTNPTDAVNVQQVTNLVGAVSDTPLTFTGNTGTVDRKLGQTLAITGDATTAGTYSGANLKTEVDPATGTVKLQMADAPAFTSVTTGNTTINNTGLTIVGGPSVTTGGINAGGTQITNVAPGTAGTDAANVDQVTAVAEQANKPLTFKGNTGTVDRKLGETLAITGEATTAGTYSGANLKTEVDPTTGELKLQMADNPEFTTVKTGDTTVSTAGVQVGPNVTLGATGLVINGGPSVTTAGIDAGGTKITNVAPGTAGTDAVNLDQVTAVATQASKPLTFTGNTGTVDRKLGETLAITGEATTAGTYSGANLKTEVDPTTGELKLQMADNPEFTTVKTGDTTVSTAGVQVGPNVTLGANGLVIVGGPSVTSAGIDAGGTKITNVAPGTVSATSTDAINGSQLYATNQTIQQLGDTVNTINNGGGIKYFHANSTAADSVASGAESVAVGPTASATATNAVAVGNGAAATQANSVALGAGSTTGVGAQAAYTGAYMAAGSSNSVGEVSVGSAGAARTVTNVADGVNATDAVNVQQLTAGVNSAVAQSNAYTDQQITNVSNGAAGMFQVSQDVTKPAPAPTGTNSAAGGAGAVASGANSVAIGNTSQATGSDSTALGQGAQATASNSVALGAGSVADRANTVSVGSVGNERQVTNVAAGTVGTDAVNVNQLNGVKAGAVNYATNPDGTVNYSQVTLGNGQAPNGTVISNVAPGVAGTDAANVNQVNAGVASANQYTDGKVGQLQSNIDKTAKDANAGTAGAMAMANLPQAYLPGKSMLSVGVASYDGASAIALGVSKLSDNGQWIVKFSASGNSRSKFGVAAGAGFSW